MDDERTNLTKAQHALERAMAYSRQGDSTGEKEWQRLAQSYALLSIAESLARMVTTVANDATAAASTKVP